MALSPERIGQISIKVLQERMMQDGVRLSPGTIKRDILNEAKKLDIPPQEMAEFVRGIIEYAYEMTMVEIEKMNKPS